MEVDLKTAVTNAMKNGVDTTEILQIVRATVSEYTSKNINDVVNDYLNNNFAFDEKTMNSITTYINNMKNDGKHLMLLFGVDEDETYRLARFIRSFDSYNTDLVDTMCLVPLLKNSIVCAPIEERDEVYEKLKGRNNPTDFDKYETVTEVTID
jgi:hypothetical protein